MLWTLASMIQISIYFDLTSQDDEDYGVEIDVDILMDKSEEAEKKQMLKVRMQYQAKSMLYLLHEIKCCFRNGCLC